ncbi:uncharacterized protein LOC132706931 [Cylas formicarius]|uniref:uncharacterized protein LOC132706931 n=1 Tax=Cylas formicarius TaxID=197179 RepID=UPI0029586246|nr:uncharacterized protein LOC132706931 [Cylas formicarius]
MDQLLRPDQEELIVGVAKRKGIVKPEIQTESGSNKGDNYLSAIVSVTVRDELGDSKLNIIAKKVLKGVQSRKSLKQIFSTEALVYQELLLGYRELQEVNNVKDPFRGSAEFYGAILDEEKETIIMQYLKENGFKLWPRKVPMDAFHVEIVIREYAKLPAASMAFKNVYPERLVLDIAYFLIINSSKEVLSDYQKYLGLYHDVLSQNLRELGLDPEKTFSSETLMDHWKKYSKFGVLMSVLFLRVNSEDIPDKVGMEKFKLSDEAEVRYKERITNAIEFMALNDLA